MKKSYYCEVVKYNFGEKVFSYATFTIYNDVDWLSYSETLQMSERVWLEHNNGVSYAKHRYAIPSQTDVDLIEFAEVKFKATAI